MMKKDINKKEALKKEEDFAAPSLKEDKEELIRSEKLAFTGRIAASIAHEIRNPLTNVSMSVQQLKKHIKPDDPKMRHMAIVEKNIDRINFLITELLNCARPSRLNTRPYNIHKLLKDVLESVKDRVKLQRIKIIKKLTASKPAVVNIDREYMERAFLNLITNAIEAMPKRGKLTIITEHKENLFVAKIQDTGRGIPAKDIMRIYEPFFSTKSKGVGLGLTICYGIIVSHSGTIEVESKPRRGSTFTVSLPIAKSE